ncbi:MAG: hypothetical protein AB9873_17905 [Syntrophobacteraceae bacterium]
MDAVSLLHTLRSRGVSLTVIGDRLICRPGSRVRDLAAAIRENKAEIMAEVQREGPPYPNGSGGVKCFYCIALKDGVCRARKETMLGISLLRSCGDYSPAERESKN